MFSPNQTNVYRLNELFRKFFYQMAEQEWGKNEIKKRHHQLAKLYRDHYRFLEALSQAVAAGEDELVIAIIMEMTERYEPSSFLQVLDGYLEQVSPSVHLAEISLFLFRCIPTSLLGQLIEPLRSIIDRCEVENSPAYGELCHRLATIYFFQGELQQALEFSTISLTFSMKQQDERMIALNLSKLAKIHRFLAIMNNQYPILAKRWQRLIYSDFNIPKCTRYGMRLNSPWMKETWKKHGVSRSRQFSCQHNVIKHRLFIQCVQ